MRMVKTLPAALNWFDVGLFILSLILCGLCFFLIQQCQLEGFTNILNRYFFIIDAYRIGFLLTMSITSS